MSQAAKVIFKHYPTAQVCLTSRERNSFLKSQNATHCVYILICNNEIIALGEGSGSRSDVVFPKKSAPGHLKALICAFATVMAEENKQEIERIFIPATSKIQAKVIENSLFTLFPSIKALSVDEKNIELYSKRLTSVSAELPQDLNQKIEMTLNELYSIFMQSLIRATGTDMNTFKKNIEVYEKIAPGFKQFLSILLGGYYKDL